MSQFSLSDNAFAVLSFLAAPAILTNACTVLALGTSNRLARAADRARGAATSLVGAQATDPAMVQFQEDEFRMATRRCELLIVALRRLYLAAGCFAAGTCVALIGAFADYFKLNAIDLAMQIATVMLALAGVGGLVHGAFTLVSETHLATQALSQQHAAVTRWRATRREPPIQPGV